jgi:radical SAM-linked protein
MRAFERALRRTNLPLRMSEGFHPKPRISFPVPLGVGFEGRDEVMEFDLAGWVAPEKIEGLLREQLPKGIGLLHTETVAPKKHAAIATGVTYKIDPDKALAHDEKLSSSSLKQLMARDEIPVERIRKRKRKTVDIRPFIKDLRRDGDAIVLDVTAGPGGSTRPEEVLAIVGFGIGTIRASFQVTRTRISLAK